MSTPTVDEAPTGDSSDAPPTRGSKSPWVFYPALGILLVVVAISTAFPTATGNALTTVQENVIGGFGWYFTLLVSAFVLFAIFLGISRFGDLTLGKDGEEPEFGLLAWFCMLFAAGMGIGLVFWGAAEPLTFFTDPKPGVSGSEATLANSAMNQVFLHWGVHAWSIYVIVGLAMAWAIHRKGRSVSLRWTLEPIFGDRVKGRLGDAVDVFAIVGTIAGVATSLGLGVEQIAAGLARVGIVPEATDPIRVVIIVVITAIATVSVVSGVGRGIKWLSNFNLGLAAVFAVLILVLGPTLFLFRDFVQNIGGYLSSIVPLSFDTSALTGADGIAWQAEWSTFYWGWWISWAPFVGVFIARISRGRTIREFVAGVLLVPTLVSTAWFTILGGTAIWRQINVGDLVGSDGVGDESVVLFDLIDTLPASGLLAGMAIVLVTIFFITSADSGSLVVDMLSSGGDADPPRWSRVLWATLAGAVAISLLLAGGLGALQTGAILTSVPFSVIMIVMTVALYRTLNSEHREITRLARRAREREWRREMSEQVTHELVGNFEEHLARPVDERIDHALGNGAGDGSGNGAASRGRRRGLRRGRGDKDGTPAP